MAFGAPLPLVTATATVHVAACVHVCMYVRAAHVYMCVVCVCVCVDACTCLFSLFLEVASVTYTCNRKSLIQAAVLPVHYDNYFFIIHFLAAQEAISPSLKLNHYT